MKKTLFLFYGTKKVIEAIQGNVDLEKRLNPSLNGKEALEQANACILDKMKYPEDYNLAVIKNTFDQGTTDIEIENYIDDIVEGLNYNQDSCSFIIEQTTTKMAILVTFSVTTRKVINIPHGKELDHLDEDELKSIASIARSHILADASDYLCVDNMTLTEDTEMPATKDEPVNYTCAKH